MNPVATNALITAEIAGCAVLAGLYVRARVYAAATRITAAWRGHTARKGVKAHKVRAFDRLLHSTAQLHRISLGYLKTLLV